MLLILLLPTLTPHADPRRLQLQLQLQLQLKFGLQWEARVIPPPPPPGTGGRLLCDGPPKLGPHDPLKEPPLIAVGAVLVPECSSFSMEKMRKVAVAVYARRRRACVLVCARVFVFFVRACFCVLRGGCCCCGPDLFDQNR
jgi:hypothetical protein